MRPIAVFGPTASGKSALGLALAQELDGEVVNVDSMQLYRGMDIGTAKPSKAEQAHYPHHLIDIIPQLFWIHNDVCKYINLPLFKTYLNLLTWV